MRNKIRFSLFGLLVAAGFALAPAAFARGHVSIGLGVNLPGISIGYAGGCRHCGWGGYYGGYYAPASVYYPASAYSYYAPAYYGYPAYGGVYYGGPVHAGAYYGHAYGGRGYYRGHDYGHRAQYYDRGRRR